MRIPYFDPILSTRMPKRHLVLGGTPTVKPSKRWARKRARRRARRHEEAGRDNQRWHDLSLRWLGRVDIKKNWTHHVLPPQRSGNGARP